MNWYKTAKSQGWQEGWDDYFGDVQRYVYDTYECRVYITRLADDKITVSTSMNHMQFGHLMWQDFWRFRIDEEAEARNTYKKVKEAIKDIFQQFKANNIPNNLLHAYMREAVRYLDVEHKPSTRVPFVDWAQDQPGSADWRSNIYGNRYPTAQDIDGF